MLLIAIRIALVLAIAYLFGLLVSSLVLIFQTSDSEIGNSRDNDNVLAMQPNYRAISQQNLPKKRWVEVDESYYLAEFVLSQRDKDE